VNATRKRSIEELRGMVLAALGEHDAAVWLFGSCARGDVRHMSDIDVGILPRGELPASFFATLAEAIEESTIPYYVDIVDLRKVAPVWLDAIRREGVQWRA
jgi:predicted nucleotidyltransferase